MIHTQAAMIHDNTPHRIFEITELTRAIASQLILTSRKSTVDLARTCRYLEEPALSTLWETQGSLDTLLKVLPEETWRFESDDHRVRDLDPPLRNRTLKFSPAQFVIVGEPSPEDWKRVQRYASWMRHVFMDDSALAEGTFHKLRLNSPAGGWFPALQDLSWCITASNLPSADLLFPPHLTKISISSPLSWGSSGIPPGVLPAIASRIAALPTSALQSLLVGVRWHHWVPWAQFKESLSSVVLRCGPSLTEFASPVPLSDEAMNHLIRLPHLRTWRVNRPPPNYSDSPLPLAFPPLAEFTIGGNAAHGWLSLLGRLEHDVPTTQGVTPLSSVKGSLKSLTIFNFPDPIIDASFASTVQIFCNLVFLSVEVLCHGRGDEGECTFKLNNDNVTQLAMALPRLESLLLGYPCFENTCATTVACLLPISVYCAKLGLLEIHFNVTNIVEDIKNISEDPRFEDLRPLPRCPLSQLSVYRIPLNLEEPDLETVAKGMIDIFPSLELCEGMGRTWYVLSERVKKLQRM